MARFDLSDFEWALVQPLLPNKPRGVARVDDQQAYPGRRVTSTRSWAGTTSSRSETSSSSRPAPWARRIWPDGLRTFQALVGQHDVGLVPDQNLDATGPLRSEHEGRTAERIKAHPLLNQQREAVYALAKIRQARSGMRS